MFVDELELIVRGGRGGNGVVSFRREKYVPKGGPDGGDGGDGGSVYLWADASKHSFLDLRYKKLLRAAEGGHGARKNQQGSRGADLFVPVPVGTIVYDLSGNILADLVEPGQKALVAKCGKGGKGNARFASSKRRVPRIAEKGLPGQERTIKLELKLIAQVGLVGFPNAGKSTLLSRISDAKPKIASYPFTTLTPNLGVVRSGEDSFIVADLPGLIEGAHQGAGLGHRFLRHVERNLILIYLIDLSPEANPDPARAYQLLNQELSLYSKELGEYPKVIVGNKIDLTGARDNMNLLQEVAQKDCHEQAACFAVSAASGEGIGLLLQFLAEQVKVISQAKMNEVTDETIRLDYQVESPLEIIKDNNIFTVSGSAIERMTAKTDFENDEALQRFQKYCRRSGLDQRLEKMGIKEGDVVRIGDEEFTYFTSS